MTMRYSLPSLVRLFAAALLIAVVPRLPAAIREVGPIELTVHRLDAILPFYTNTLPFELVGISTAQGPALERLLDLPGATTRSAELKLGQERILLTEFPHQAGRPIPPDSRSLDHWFQHIAIVVRDMDAAYARLRAHRVRHVSTAPQTLPAWNPAAGGIKAFYFRDPEDHVLEIIWFPAGKGDPRWQQTAVGPNAPVFLGIDHTAIVVSDTERSLGFYRDVLGLRIAGTAENHGPEQERLNQVFGARLRITALRAERGPGIEFLEYLAPPGGRPAPEDSRANDLISWRTHLGADSPHGLRSVAAGATGHTMSATDASGPFVIRDPDRHALQVHVPKPGPLSVRQTKSE